MGEVKKRRFEASFSYADIRIGLTIVECCVSVWINISTSAKSLDTQTLVFRLHQKNNRGGLELEVQPCVLRWSCDGTPLKNVRWVYIRCLGRSNSRRAVCHQSVLYVNISTIKHSLVVKSQVESWLSLQSRTSNCHAKLLTYHIEGSGNAYDS